MGRKRWDIASSNDEILIQAASEGDCSDVQALLERGVNANAKTSHGWTPLHKACWRRRLAVIKLLIEKGADVNVKAKNGETPLHEACLDGSLDVVKILIENGADPNSKDVQNGETPLHWASERNHPEVVFWLLRQCPWLVPD